MCVISGGRRLTALLMVFTVLAKSRQNGPVLGRSLERMPVLILEHAVVAVVMSCYYNYDAGVRDTSVAAYGLHWLRQLLPIHGM